MSIIKAPFNFVPLNEKVVSPYWAEHISHDLPFEDGRSGTLEVTLTTHSPLFVRDGRKTEGEVQQFCQTEDGRYFIPGSSLKGMIRSVMEVMTFSRMKLVNKHRFAYRDFYNNNLYKVSEISKSAETGWLSWDRNTRRYALEECGKPGRVHMRELNKLNPKKDLYSFFTLGQPGFGFDANKDEHKSAEFKYNQLSNPYPRIKVSPKPAGKGGNKHDYRKKFVIEGLADDETINVGQQRVGTLVVTGQPDARKEKGRPSGKVYEFVFWDPKKTIDLGEEPKVVENMEWAYLNQKDEKEQSLDWQYHKKRLYQGHKIPVFYHKNNGEISSMGLSLLYKFAYQNSVVELIEKRQGQPGISLAEAIFGYTEKKENDGKNEEKTDALKGRVHIGHAMAREGTVELDEVKKEVLASPKASYYPIYVRQSMNGNRVNQYLTYNDNSASIAGRKRYPVRSGGVIKNQPNSKVVNPDKVTTQFQPIKKGTFTFSIQYHNLKEVELGALISALTFHGHEDAFHSLGMAKPLGYGRIKLKVENEEDYTGAMRAFESFMTASLGIHWHRTPEVKELFAMVHQHQGADQNLAYMDMEKQEFAKAKKAREGLDRYSRLKGVNEVQIQPLSDQQTIDTAKRMIEQGKKQFLQKQQYDDFLQQQKSKHKKAFTKQLEARKRQLLAQLQKRKKEVEGERRQILKDAAAKAAQQKGPEISDIDPSYKKAFDESLRKEMSRYSDELYPHIKEKNLPQEYPNGWLPSEFHIELEALILSITQNASKKDRKNWGKKYEKNAKIKKVAEWIGETKARDLLKKIQDQLK